MFNQTKQLLLLLSILISLLWTPIFQAKEGEKAGEGITSNSVDTPLPLQEIKTFAEIFVRIKHSYVGEVTDEKLLDYAIVGMLSGLDPHSVYLQGDDFSELKEGASGRFGGLGIEVIMEDGFVKVVAPIDDTPAARADIQSGDLFIRIDGKPVNGLSLNEAIDLMRGKIGTPVTLTILRGENNEPFNVTLNRDLIRVETVRSKQLGDNIGYIRISQFQEPTAELFRKELAKIDKPKPLSGLVLDLRNNPGGTLNSAVAISNTFIQQGLLVSIKGRDKNNVREYEATPNDVLNGRPIVVLINGGSASASEIVAGALQDHQRALIVGTQSFGKGSVQSIIDIDDKTGIKLTTARYYTPSGKSIQASGIRPDIMVEQRQFKETPDKWQRIKENDLRGHLENDNITKTDTKNENKHIVIKDYQLNEAFNLLKGLSVLQKQNTNDKDKN